MNRIARFSGGLCVLAAVLLAGCSSTPEQPVGDGGYATGKRPSKDGAPLRKIRPEDVPDMQPKAEALARYGNKSPYQVWGKSYTVMPSSAGYVARGTASWYGTKFHGQPTSSREPYDLYIQTAAHKSLPLPTYVRVTNLGNGRSTIVKVNDRGPFHGDRIIDLSYAAAVKLGYADIGTAQVLVESIDPRDMGRGAQRIAQSARPAAAAASATPNRVSSASAVSGQRFVQAGAYSSLAAAEQVRRQVAQAVDQQVLISETRQPDRTVYRVRVGPLSAGHDEQMLLAQVSSAVGGAKVVVD